VLPSEAGVEVLNSAAAKGACNVQVARDGLELDSDLTSNRITIFMGDEDDY